MIVIDITNTDLYLGLVVLRDGLKELPALPKSAIREYNARLDIAESVGTDAKIISEIRRHLSTISSRRNGSYKFHSGRKFEPLPDSYGNCRDMERVRRYSKVIV